MAWLDTRVLALPGTQELIVKQVRNRRKRPRSLTCSGVAKCCVKGTNRKYELLFFKCSFVLFLLVLISLFSSFLLSFLYYFLPSSLLYSFILSRCLPYFLRSFLLPSFVSSFFLLLTYLPSFSLCISFLFCFDWSIYHGIT